MAKKSKKKSASAKSNSQSNSQSNSKKDSRGKAHAKASAIDKAKSTAAPTAKVDADLMNRVYAVSDEAIWRNGEDDSLSVLRLSDSQVFRLTLVMKELFLSLDGKLSVGEALTKVLPGHHAVGRPGGQSGTIEDKVLKQVQKFVEQLAEERLIEQVRIKPAATTAGRIKASLVRIKSLGAKKKSIEVDPKKMGNLVRVKVPGGLKAVVYARVRM